MGKSYEERDGGYDKGAATKAVIGHNSDAIIRKFGYIIHSRPNNGESIWEIGGKLYKYSEVLTRISIMQDMEKKILAEGSR